MRHAKNCDSMIRCDYPQQQEMSLLVQSLIFSVLYSLCFYAKHLLRPGAGKAKARLLFNSSPWLKTYPYLQSNPPLPQVLIKTVIPQQTDWREQE